MPLNGPFFLTLGACRAEWVGLKKKPIGDPTFHRAVQVVMVGDQCQLPPTVLCDEAGREGLDLSMFDRLISEGLQPGPPLSGGPRN